MIQETKNNNKHPMCERVRKARENANLSIEDAAKKLSLQYGTYLKYELRSALPEKHRDSFCALTNVNINWLVNNSGPMQGAISTSNNIPEDIADMLQYLEIIKNLDPDGFAYQKRILKALSTELMTRMDIIIDENREKLNKQLQDYNNN